MKVRAKGNMIYQQLVQIRVFPVELVSIDAVPALLQKPWKRIYLAPEHNLTTSEHMC